MFSVLIGFVVAMFAVGSYGSYQADSFSNQIDVCQHLNNVVTTTSVPHGQTVRFGTGGFSSNEDQFASWLQAMQQNNVTSVYFVPRGSWWFTYNGAALYFEYKGVIYLYQ